MEWVPHGFVTAPPGARAPRHDTVGRVPDPTNPTLVEVELRSFLLAGLPTPHSIRLLARVPEPGRYHLDMVAETATGRPAACRPGGGEIHRGRFHPCIYLPGRFRPCGRAPPRNRVRKNEPRIVAPGGRAGDESRGPQRGASSPLLANVYLHYVLDLWVQQWRRRRARGDMIITRFADDFIVGFEHRSDAEQFLDDLRERLAKFALELHADKTRLLEFGRHADRNRRARGLGRPETFDFLGFTHTCARTQEGRFMLKRTTITKRMRTKLREVKAELMRRRHRPIPEQGR